jgi:hypothetical protein
MWPGPATYRGARFFDRKIRITRTTTAKIPDTTRIRVTLSIVSPPFKVIFGPRRLQGKKYGSVHSRDHPLDAHAVGNIIPQKVPDRMSSSTNSIPYLRRPCSALIWDTTRAEIWVPRLLRTRTVVPTSSSRVI